MSIFRSPAVIRNVSWIEICFIHENESATFLYQSSKKAIEDLSIVQNVISNGLYWAYLWLFVRVSQLLLEYLWDVPWLEHQSSVFFERINRIFDQFDRDSLSFQMKQSSFDFFDLLFVNLECFFFFTNSFLLSFFNAYDVMIDVLMKFMRSDVEYLPNFLWLSLLIESQV